jgi:hypothetical protein
LECVNLGEFVAALTIMLVSGDPDGRRVRLSTGEKHGPELAGPKDDPRM